MPRERGFTMIELLVAMVLLAIALAMVSTVLIQALSGGSSGRAGSVSDAAVARTMSALQDDLGAALTADRRDARLRDPDEFATAVRTGAPAFSSDPSSPGAVDLDDVVTATPTMLEMIGDFAPNPGYECVSWQATTSSGSGSGSGYQLMRMVGPASSCGSGSISSRRMLHAPAGASGVNAAPFSYELVCNQTLCAADPGADASAPCRPWITTGAVATARRRWVVGVVASLTQVSGSTNSAQSAGTMKASITSRRSDSYRQALGC